MELDYFSLYLRYYLRDHGFREEELNADIVKINADNAAQTYENERKGGNSVCGATELANRDLFVGIGLSRLEAAADILEENFGDRVPFSQSDVFDFWTQKLAENDSLWDAYHKEGELGLNEDLVSEGKDDLLHRIDQILISHGV